MRWRKEAFARVETASEEAWLVVEHGGRRIVLVAELAPDPSTRELLSGLLYSVLVRAADYVNHRRVCERMEMLTSASFEGIMIHVDGVVIDVNQRLGEILGRDRSEMLGATLLRESVACFST
jgi:PAS domain-containing protein